MNAFTIKDIENLSGIKAHTIRVWEQRYSFLNPKRTSTNIRYYTNDELKTILNISLLNRYGYKISHICRMSSDEIKEKILTFAETEAHLDRVCNELIQEMIDIDQEGFEATIDKYIHSHGIEKTILSLIFPFLERIGILWHTNKINPVHEHVVSNVIRQKLIMGIESIPHKMTSRKTATLFLPEGEHHEIGLLFVHYLLKKRGVSVLYVGANVPLKDIGALIKLKETDVFYTHLTSVTRSFSLEKFIHDISPCIRSTPLLISGKLAHGFKKRIPSNVHLKNSLQEVLDYFQD